MSAVATAHIERSVRELHHGAGFSNPCSMDENEMISLLSLIPAGAFQVRRMRDSVRSSNGRSILSGSERHTAADLRPMHSRLVFTRRKTNANGHLDLPNRLPTSESGPSGCS
jgi:hypothetical protein